MGILNPKPKLEPDETLMLKSLANHVQGPGYSLGGTRERLGIRTKDGVEVFVVNKLEKTMNELRGLLPHP